MTQTITKTDLADLNETFDVVFDTVGKSNISKTIKIIKPGGRYLHAVTTPSTELKIRFNLLRSKVKLVGGTFKPTVEHIDLIGKLAEDGFLKPVIDRQYSFDEIVAAHAYVDKGRKRGNVTIKIIDE